MVEQQPEQMTTENGKLLLYLLYVTFFCAHVVLKRLFVKLMKLIYKTMRLRRTSSMGFLCALLIIIITVRRSLMQTALVQQPWFKYRFQAIC